MLNTQRRKLKEFWGTLKYNKLLWKIRMLSIISEQKAYIKFRAYGNNGKPVGAGVTVTFKVNGKTYNVKTDKKGYASISIKLKSKQYVVTAQYNELKVSNNHGKTGTYNKDNSK